MRFYLGTHQPHWLWELGLPFFVSHRRLKDRKTFGRALGPWCLDSGGFTELSQFGEWRSSPGEYAEAVNRYQDEIGNLVWAAPQDWMCEPHVLNMTGLTVREHQERTVENYLSLTELGGPYIPVLQGWHLDDYLQCVDLYGEAGIDLTQEPVVGVGSVCRRQGTADACEVFTQLADLGIKSHGFGVKVTGLREYGHLLVSADSMAWSYAARYQPALPGCRGHKNCANCRRFAIRWWADIQYTL